jgi:hypothetical protein
MAVYEMNGALVLTPTSARAGGTIVEGVMEDIADAMQLLIPFRGRYARVGLGAKGGLETRAGHEQPITLQIPFKNRKNLAQARTLMLSHVTTSGTNMAPHGGTATKPHATPPSFALMVRPIAADEPHLYAPRWRVVEFQEVLLTYGQSVSHVDGNILYLMANQAHGATARPWLYGAYADINTEYGWSEPS